MTPLDWILASMVVGLALALWRQIGVADDERRERKRAELTIKRIGEAVAANRGTVQLGFDVQKNGVEVGATIITPEVYPGG